MALACCLVARGSLLANNLGGYAFLVLGRGYGDAVVSCHYRAVIYEQARQRNLSWWQRSIRCWYQPQWAGSIQHTWEWRQTQLRLVIGLCLYWGYGLRRTSGL